MIICPNCNSELEDGTKFCPTCGTKLEAAKPVVEQTPVVEAAPVVDTTPVSNPVPEREDIFEQQASVNEQQAPVNEQQAPVNEQKKPLPVKLIAMVAGVVVVIVLAIVLVSSFFGGSSQNYAVFMKDDELHINMLKGKESIEITSDFAGDYSSSSDLYYNAVGLVQLTDDGKTIIYPDKFDSSDYSFDLYYRSATKKNADGEKIASSISSYVLSDNGKLMIYKNDNGLYEYDFKDSEKIERDVVSYWVSNDCKTVLYTDDEGDLYLKNSGKDAEKLESEVNVVSVSDDRNTVYFTKNDSLYKKVGTEDREKIDSDITNVITVYEDGQIYYVKSKTEKVKLSDYINDDMAEKDSSMVEPTYPNYNDFDWPKRPWSFDYASYEEYEKAYEKYEEEYNRVSEEYNQAYDAYTTAWQEWSTKSTRDYWRENFKSTTFDITKSSLYYYDGKETVVVTDAFAYNTNYAASGRTTAPAMLINVEQSSEVAKIKMSEITDYYSVQSSVESKLSTTALLSVVNEGTLTTFDEDETTSYRISSDGKTAYYMADIEDEHGDLYAISIASGKAGKAEKYDSDVYAYSFLSTADGDIVYFKDVDTDNSSSNGELYVNKEKIENDVYISSVRSVGDAGAFCYLSDYGNYEGKLNYLKDSKPVEIADDVYARIAITAEGGLLYLQDYNADRSRGDLYYSVDGKEGQFVDDDVTVVVRPYMY